MLFSFLGSGQLDNFTDPTVKFIFREWFGDINYTWKYITTMGILATIAFTFVFKAYSSYSTSVTSIFEYSLIIWSVILGYVLFNDIPITRTIVGCIIVISSGMFIFFREKIRDQKTNLENPLRR